MPSVFNPEHRKQLHSRERKKEIPPEKMLHLMQIRQRDVMLDIGAGSGYFSLPALELVGRQGRVVAVDISEIMLSQLRDNALDMPGNLCLIKAEAARLPVKSETVDHTLCAMILHECADLAAVIAETARVTKPGAMLHVLEWKKQTTPKGPPLSERISRGELMRHLEPLFEPEYYEDISSIHYAAGFRRRPR